MSKKSLYSLILESERASLRAGKGCHLRKGISLSGDHIYTLVTLFYGGFTIAADESGMCVSPLDPNGPAEPPIAAPVFNTSDKELTAIYNTLHKLNAFPSDQVRLTRNAKGKFTMRFIVTKHVSDTKLRAILNENKDVAVFATAGRLYVHVSEK
jgi:hypothetical protein